MQVLAPESFPSQEILRALLHLPWLPWIFLKNLVFRLRHQHFFRGGNRASPGSADPWDSEQKHGEETVSAQPWAAVCPESQMVRNPGNDAPYPVNNMGSFLKTNVVKSRTMT